MKTVHQQITYSVRTCSARFLSCCEGLEFLSSDCGVWFSTVELVRPDASQVTREGADWLHASKNIPFLSWHPCQYDRPHWGGHQPSDPAGWGHLRGGQAMEGGDQMPPTLFSQGWLSPWLQDPQAPPKKSPLEELASGLQEVDIAQICLRTSKTGHSPGARWIICPPGSCRGAQR